MNGQRKSVVIVILLGCALKAQADAIHLECSGEFGYWDAPEKGSIRWTFPVTIDKDAQKISAPPFLSSPVKLDVEPRWYSGQREGRYCFSTSTTSVLDDSHCGEGASVISIDRVTLEADAAFNSSKRGGAGGFFSGSCHLVEAKI